MADSKTDTATRDPHMASPIEGTIETGVVHRDDTLLMSMGKKPELKRVYNFWTLIAYQIMMSAS